MSSDQRKSGSAIWTLPGADWIASGSKDLAILAAQLEAGVVVFLPNVGFAVEAAERGLFSASIAAGKNVSFDPRPGRLGKTTLEGGQLHILATLLQRFSDRAAKLVNELLPTYAPRLERARASFRPAEIVGRKTSWRHDDTRLHVDSFPATPVAGKRILRLFSNVNPEGHPRCWRIGEPFDLVARRFASELRMPWRGSGSLRRLLGLTKSRRTAYDALMLQLHDLMKADLAYHRSASQTMVEFPAGSTWIAFTDQVSHAAMSGQYQLEQTFLLPVDAMHDPKRSPLRILERLTGRSLV